MDWNKEVIKGPFPWWAIALCAITAGCFFCWLINTDPSHPLQRDAVHIIPCFLLGASGYLYLWSLCEDGKESIVLAATQYEMACADRRIAECHCYFVVDAGW
jgi:hypothetical protein